MSAQANLVVNGDFEAGNTGFTSGYAYSPGGNGTEGQYTVRSTPAGWNGAFVDIPDHTPGTGTQMFVGNGSPTAGQIVWQSSAIDVAAGTGYFFEAWAANVCCLPSYTGVNSPAVLEFFVVGNVGSFSLGAIPTQLVPGTWQFLQKNFNSGGNTQLTLQILNQNTTRGGNDFALDDIFLDTRTSAVVPEPSTLALLGLGLAGLFIGVIRRPRA